ncbi:(Fe-S)-binding protein [Rubinisphaera sp.]|uniref:(Fe-S)-binding protein n=1 Tax=Rubinisphaera sp. TaxID=2024857 RepID=UPI000C0CBCD1|nr:(Fe-S)-binding protein [Rubinisphaera sp.]MBV08976.1 Fe-S oxidoreductase [Rubinisphaera sp.]|tara:strand:+ start:5797 stop:6552 length:756 start_codon:yes stop_codon:yes gene_type:complete
MQVALFVPCYIDQLYPNVAWATLELLEKLGCEVTIPDAPVCCGQPMANTGCWDDARPLAKSFIEQYDQYEYIVCPSGSCTSMIVNHYHDLVGEDANYERIRLKTFELCAFLTDVLKVEKLDVSFPHKVGLHQSCHGLRELNLGSCSEVMGEEFSKARTLLEMVDGLELVDLTRKDECCGFGGTFAVSEEAVSCMMGNDRIHDHEHAGAEVITAGDMSCLMHLDGLIKRQKKPIRTMHIAEILAGRDVAVNT